MHLKDHEKALELCETAINDPWLRTSVLTSIKRRLKRLKKSSESIVETELEEEQPEILTLKGKIQGGNVTGKRWNFTWTGTICHLEQLKNSF